MKENLEVVGPFDLRIGKKDMESGDILSYALIDGDSQKIASITAHFNVAILLKLSYEMAQTLKGIQAFVEDGNVVELRPCGFCVEVEEIVSRIPPLD